MDSPRVVSLFCGCGGLDLGFKLCGFDIVYACDNDLAAVDSYSRNIDSNVFQRDVSSAEFHEEIADLGGCAVVLGGFPCQGFSKAGPKTHGDVRNQLYVEMKEAIRSLTPAVFVGENVDGLSQNFEGRYLRQIISDFSEIGYRVDYRILDAAAFGIPQHRRRIIFIGTRNDVDAEFAWPNPTNLAEARNGEFKVCEPMPLFETSPQKVLPPPMTIADAIGDLLELDSAIPDHEVTYAWPEKYEAIFRAIGPGQKLCNVRHAPSSVYTWQIPEVFGQVSEREKRILETIGRYRRHKKYGDIPNGNPLPLDEIERLSAIHGIRAEVESLTSKGYLKEKGQCKFDLKGAMFCSGQFKRPLWDGPSPTVLTNFHNPRYFLHPLRDRPFTLRECARLQGFPDTFIFTSDEVELVDGYRLVGNAVPPGLSSKIGECVMQVVEAASRSPILR